LAVDGRVDRVEVAQQDRRIGIDCLGRNGISIAEYPVRIRLVELLVLDDRPGTEVDNACLSSMNADEKQECQQRAQSHHKSLSREETSWAQTEASGWRNEAISAVNNARCTGSTRVVRDSQISSGGECCTLPAVSALANTFGDVLPAGVASAFIRPTA